MPIRQNLLHIHNTFILFFLLSKNSYLDVDNCLELHLFSAQTNNKNIETATYRVICNNWGSLSQKPEFWDLPDDVRSRFAHKITNTK